MSMLDEQFADMKDWYCTLWICCMNEVWHLRVTLHNSILRTHLALFYTPAYLIAATVPAMQCIEAIKVQSDVLRRITNL